LEVSLFAQAVASMPSIFLLRWGVSPTFYLGLASNCDPLHFSLSSSWDYRQELLVPLQESFWNRLLKKLLCTFMSENHWSKWGGEFDVTRNVR
jgi:hypothetical protein